MRKSFTKEDTAVTASKFFCYFFYFTQGCPSFVKSEK